MRFISVYSVGRVAPMAAWLLFVAGGAGAQDGPPVADDDELQPITLEDSRHVSDPVFDDDIPEELEAPPPQVSDQERLQLLFKLYRDAVSDGMFAEADTLGKQIVELSIAANGLDSEESARAITNLAIAQHGNGDYDSALLNFSSAIEIIERISDRLNEDLINPLKGLAASQLALGRSGEATETYGRAVHISHVNYGPHNLDQIEILESLAETYIASGDLDQAGDMQERMFALQARNVDANSVDILPALRTQARWLHRLQLYDRERYTWRRVISILEDHRGRNDLSLIHPLTMLGKSYLFIAPIDVSYNQPASNTTGEIYLKRALRIAEDHPESDWQTKTQAMLALGDFYILTDKPSRAERMYRDTWELLDGDEERLKLRQSELQTLTVLYDAQPPKFYGLESGSGIPRQPDGFETGTVVYQYSVSVRGKPTNIELVEAQPPVFEDMERAVGREIRRMVQRPRIVDGDSVQTDNLTYTHSFYYRESDLPEATTADGGAAQ